MRINMHGPITTFKIVSFGCKVNQTEGFALADRLRRRGLVQVGRRAHADLVIVNTCCVTAEAARQGRQRVRRALRRGTTVAVTGCAAHPASGDAALGRIEGLAAVDADKDRLLARLAETGCLPAAARAEPDAPGRSVEPAAEAAGHPHPPWPTATPDGDARLLPQPARKAGGSHRAGATVCSSNRAPRSQNTDWQAIRGTACGGPSQPRSRAMLKVQDGCPGGCAYCIVPKVRPEVRSVPPEEAARRAAALVAEGFREIVVCGIHLGLYGVDLEPRDECQDVIPTEASRSDGERRNLAVGPNDEIPRLAALARNDNRSPLAGLLARLLEVEGLGRLRLSSILPTEVDAALLDLMAAEPERLCPHLHLSLQSGDDAVLAEMGRPYTAEAFLRTVARVRAALDEPALTTDVLVGFPGETDAAFERTLAVCREAGFARMHVFPFSARPGTRAAAMPGRVPRQVAR
ncbi:MAG: radical SAM protein, partial [Phycisphaerae bacterium]